MKKSILILSLTALLGASSLYASNEGEVVSSDNNSAVLVEKDVAKVDGLDLCLIGRIGGYDASMNINNGRGVVELYGAGVRTVSVKSRSGNKLVLNSYLNGKYIGYYSGTLVRYGYKGVFYNTRTGGKVNFDLSYCGDADLY